MELDQIELGALIRKRRKELGLTLSDLANDHMSVPTLSNIERGAVSRVNDDNLAYIMDRLGLTEDDLQNMRRQSAEGKRRFTGRLTHVRHLIELQLYEEARHELNALEQEPDLKDYPAHRISAQLQKGILYRKLHQWERAKRTLHHVIRLAQEAKAEEANNLAAEAYYFLAICTFYGEQDYEKAIEYINIALNTFEENETNRYTKGQILYDKANYYFHLGRYGEAYKYVTKARTISEQVHDIRALIYEHNLEGLILYMQKMHHQAIRIIEKAIDLSRKYYPAPEIGSLLYLNLAEIYQSIHAPDKAIQCLDYAHKLCRRTNDTYVLTLVYTVYGEAYYQKKEYAEANRFIDNATKMAKKFKLNSEYLQLLMLKAKIALDQASEKIVHICKEGIQLAENTKLYDKKKEFHFFLANYYEQHGNNDEFIEETENLFRVEKVLMGGS